jgi:hypothetical protein
MGGPGVRGVQGVSASRGAQTSRCTATPTEHQVSEGAMTSCGRRCRRAQENAPEVPGLRPSQKAKTTSACSRSRAFRSGPAALPRRRQSPAVTGKASTVAAPVREGRADPREVALLASRPRPSRSRGRARPTTRGSACPLLVPRRSRACGAALGIAANEWRGTGVVCTKGSVVRVIGGAAVDPLGVAFRLAGVAALIETVVCLYAKVPGALTTTGSIAGTRGARETTFARAALSSAALSSAVAAIIDVVRYIFALWWRPATFFCRETCRPRAEGPADAFAV